MVAGDSHGGGGGRGDGRGYEAIFVRRRCECDRDEVLDPKRAILVPRKSTEARNVTPKSSFSST